jgi:predicted ester cyclase
VSEAEEKNRALVRWWWEEVWVKGNVAAVDEFIAANYVDHPSLPGVPPGPEGMKQALTYYRTAFPSLKATVDDIFAGGDRVALRWSARDRHLGEWLGVPPTGQHFTISGISIYRIAQGKAVEGWNSIEVNPTEEEQRWLSGRRAQVSDLEVWGLRPRRGRRRSRPHYGPATSGQSESGFRMCHQTPPS